MMTIAEPGLKAVAEMSKAAVEGVAYHHERMEK
jgi:HD-GYP domain-containing protein (c-di-GMP phosphodiesterase class II)